MFVSNKLIVVALTIIFFSFDYYYTKGARRVRRTSTDLCYYDRFGHPRQGRERDGWYACIVIEIAHPLREGDEKYSNEKISIYQWHLCLLYSNEFGL